MTGIQPLTKSPPSSPPLHTDAQGVQLRSVTKKYGSFTAVENITLDIPAGSYCCLLGPSGCGKTTTLRMLAGHETVTSGDIFIGAERVTEQPPAQRNTAMVFQNYALFPHKTVWDNVGFGLKMRGVSERDRAPLITEMLAIVGMEAFAHRKPTQLSGGQQQRVALARALANRPQVLLLDEPLSALDESLRIKTRSELRRLQKQFGMTFIQVTHAQDEAFALSDVIVVMDHGRVDQMGSGIEIYTRPASTFVAQFVGDNNIFRGTVIDSEAAVGGDHIRLDVPDLGPVHCIGHTVPNGQAAACCIRADQLQISDPDQPTPHPNRLTARIVAVEFTGYITRIALLQESNGQELLYKAQTEAWLATDYQEGQVITLSWAASDCIFLPH